MQKIEAAVGHDHTLTLFAGRRDSRQQFRRRNYRTVCILILASQRGSEFLAAGGGRTKLADDDACRHIRQIRRTRPAFAGGDTGRQNRDHGIAGAGHVEDLARFGRQGQRRSVRLDQAHAVLASSHQQRCQIKGRTQGLGFAEQILFASGHAGHGFEFTEVGRKQAGTAIGRPVIALGVDDHRLAGSPRGGNHRRGADQAAFAVVGQQHHIRLRQGRLETRLQRIGVEGADGGQCFLEVQTDQLLVARDHTQFGDGRAVGRFHELRVNPAGKQMLGQQPRRFITTDNAQQGGPHAQRGGVERRVGGAAGPGLVIAHTHHRHRRLGRNPRGRAVPVTVEHHIANHQHTRAREIRQLVAHEARAPALELDIRCRRASPDNGRCDPSPDSGRRSATARLPVRAYLRPPAGCRPRESA